MKVFIFIKEKSHRLKNKNFLDLGGTELYKHTLLKLKDFDVYVDTDSKKIYDECNSDKNLSHVTCFMRDKKYIEIEERNEELGPTLLMTRDFLDNYVSDEDETIVLTHVTSPFLEVKTILKATDMLGSHDSVCSVSEIKSFVLKRSNIGKFTPINFDIDKLQKTQTLDSIFHLNSAFFIFTKQGFIQNNNNRIGKNPYYYKIGFPENIDIDYKEDYLVAKHITEKRLFPKNLISRRNLVSRAYKPEDSIFDISDVLFGGNKIPIIAGPCSVESEDQLFRIAEKIKECGADMIRGGAFKPRTSPYSFQGLGEEGLKILAKAKEEFDIPFVTEALDETSALLGVEYGADMLQIGTRNMQNYSLLKFIGKFKKPVILKRGMCATLEEFLMSAEYLMSNGCEKVILCERGIRAFSKHARAVLDIGIIPAVKKESHLPIIVDPSHSSGNSYSVIAHALGGVGAGAQGVLVEVHDRPDEALSDGQQALLPDQLKELVKKIRKLEIILNQ